MTIAFDAFTASTAGTGGDLSWTHTPSTTPRGAIVWLLQSNSSEDVVTSVTYGGAAMTESTDSPTLLGPGNNQGAYCYFLGSGLTTAAATVTVSLTSTSIVRNGYSVTLSAADNTEIVDTGIINSTAVTDPSVVLSLAARTCFAAIGGISGVNASTDISPLTGWTARSELDHGALVAVAYTFDTVGTTDVTAGWTSASDEATAIAIAVSEVQAGGGDLGGIRKYGGLGSGFAGPLAGFAGE